MSAKAATGSARVSLSPRSLTRLRLSTQLTRWLVYALAAAGLVASARYAVAPPRPRVINQPPAPRVDAGAAAYATLFARRYLTWDAARPDAYASSLAGFLGDRVDATAGLRLPGGGTQHVEWADVVSTRDVSVADHVYTVAAQTVASAGAGDVAAAAVVYLSVEVARDPVDGLRLSSYPAFVGAPVNARASTLARPGSGDVSDQALSRVVERTLRNYLGGSASNLAADLVAGAHVTLPPNRLVLQQLSQLQWRADHGGVLALVVAGDTRGTSYTLAYELDVRSVAGRWEVAAIQTDPTT